MTLGFLCLNTQAYAHSVKADMYHLTIDDDGKFVGTIVFENTQNGIFVQENFKNLPTGKHGIHIHENGRCDLTYVDGKPVLGGAAGGHFDPQKTTKHAGPNGNGHKGDLPVLTVKPDGTATDSFFLKGLSTDDIKGRSVIIHAGGDNYRDTPQPLGGGGNRIACGIIK